MMSSLLRAVHLALGVDDKVMRLSFIWSLLFQSSDGDSSTSAEKYLLSSYSNLSKFIFCRQSIYIRPPSNVIRLIENK